jgi:hydrogenase expression/formation protein HypC
MCLAVPAKIVSLNGNEAMCDIQGVKRLTNVAFIDNPAVGDFVLLHAGFAIQKWADEDVQDFYDVISNATPVEPDQ